MNNKGFTLVELLAVMVILISISLVTVSSVTSSLTRREDKECQEQQELAISAAKIYFSLNGSTSVTIEQLNGGIAPDYTDYFKDDKKIDKLGENDIISFTSRGYTYKPTGNSCADEISLVEEDDEEDTDAFCTIGTTYEKCLLEENRPDTLWTNTLNENEYRFVGKAPDNYMCFGTKDVNTCLKSPKKYMYRIIGIFNTSAGNKYLKLIKNTSIGTIEMDDKYNINNVWKKTTLYSKINGSSFLTKSTYSYLQDSTWLSKIKKWTYTSADTNLTSSGNDGDVVLWKKTPKQIYCFERNLDCNTQSGGSYAEVSAKIGLMYVSDYVLSLGEIAVNSSGGVKDNRSSLKKSWMFSGTKEWTMMRAGNAYTTPYATNARFYSITDTGYPYTYENRWEHAVRPVFYMSANELYAGGTGMLTDPFMIVVK